MSGGPIGLGVAQNDKSVFWETLYASSLLFTHSYPSAGGADCRVAALLAMTTGKSRSANFSAAASPSVKMTLDCRGRKRPHNDRCGRFSCLENGM